MDNFLRAAGTFQVELFALATFRPTLQYILENFSHAPSRDLEPATLHMLVQLMCGQVVCLSTLRLLRPPPSRRASVSTRKQCWLVEKRSWCWPRRLPTLVKLTIRWSEERLHSHHSSIPGAGGHAAGSGLCPLLLALPGPGAKQVIYPMQLNGNQVKREHFRALADQHVAQCLLSSAELSSRSLDLLHYLHDCAEVTEAERPEVPTTRSQRKYLGGF